MEKYEVIGLMSGTSLDGLDIAYCIFELSGDKWTFKIRCAETVPYSEEWKKHLTSIETGSAFDLAETDIQYGQLIGQLTRSFMDRMNVRPGFIASHGHTVFHQPQKKLTWQIGKGSSIAVETGLPVVCDFRSTDVALGGQGAPLVPVGDRLLFGGYDYCLNLGGFSNISFEKDNSRVAFDICPCNIILNNYASKLGKPFDESGNLARSGHLNEELLLSLNDLSFYKMKGPKSLGKEWVLQEILPLLDQSNIPPEDILHTVTEHIADQISGVIQNDRSKKILVTGGGAFNTFLIERLGAQTPVGIVIPDKDTINFKEALIFAFLGVLRWRGEINCLQSYTGASKDNTGGSIYLNP